MGILITADFQWPEREKYAEYFSHLESIKESFPPSVYEFATADWHYDFSDPRSPHDSWLQKLEIIEPAEGDRKQMRSCEVKATFLGAYHDRNWIFHYKKVANYSFVAPSVLPGHGDFHIDEFASSGAGNFSHRIQFASGALFSVECADMAISEEVFEK